MSLDWDISKCKNHEDITLDQEVEGDITEQIIWSSLTTKLGNITETNWTEWYARYTLWNKIHGFDNSIEPKDFHRRIGMSTNVFPAESRSKWLNGMMKSKLDNLVENAELQVEMRDNIEVSEKMEKEKELVE